MILHYMNGVLTGAAFGGIAILICATTWGVAAFAGMDALPLGILLRILSGHRLDFGLVCVGLAAAWTFFVLGCACLPDCILRHPLAVILLGFAISGIWSAIAFDRTSSLHARIAWSLIAGLLLAITSLLVGGLPSLLLAPITWGATAGAYAVWLTSSPAPAAPTPFRLHPPRITVP